LEFGSDFELDLHLVEVRWGAEVGTEEYANCLRHAPAAQIKQMTTVRDWFREAKRPAR
jgi:hypothetical protein